MTDKSIYPRTMPLADKLKLYNKAKCDPNLTAGEKNVFGQLLLVFHNTKTGRCDPSEPQIAATLRVSERHVRDAVGELKERGWLTVQRRYNKSLVYEFNWDRITDASYPMATDIIKELRENRSREEKCSGLGGEQFSGGEENHDSQSGNPPQPERKTTTAREERGFRLTHEEPMNELMNETLNPNPPEDEEDEGRKSPRDTFNPLQSSNDDERDNSYISKNQAPPNDYPYTNKDERSFPYTHKDEPAFPYIDKERPGPRLSFKGDAARAAAAAAAARDAAAAAAAVRAAAARDACWKKIRATFPPSNFGHNWKKAEKIVADEGYAIEMVLSQVQRFSEVSAKKDPQFVPAIEAWLGDGRWQKEYPRTVMEQIAAQQQTNVVVEQQATPAYDDDMTEEELEDLAKFERLAMANAKNESKPIIRKWDDDDDDDEDLARFQ